MITDNQTNFLFLADSLPKKYACFYDEFQRVLRQRNIEFALLPHTKDVWAVDYMPIQISKDHFIQFTYNPDYLRSTQKWRKTISDVDAICKSINLKTQKSSIILDGGNVVRSSNKVIMTDKVFKENPHFKEKELIRELENLFQVNQLIFIPTDPDDFTGHADGMVRFYDENTVLIHRYSHNTEELYLRLRLSLHNAGLDFIEIPFGAYPNAEADSAFGYYINYLQMQQAIIIPTFAINTDDVVIRKLEELFPDQKILSINCNELAPDGGLLNCISWNVYK